MTSPPQFNAAPYAALALTLVTANAWAVNCMIEAKQIVEIRSPVEGIIESITVARGDTVRRGQILATLESGPERAALDVARSKAYMEGVIQAAEARADLARRKADRATELARQNFVSSNARDEADAELRVADSQLREAKDNQRVAHLDVKRGEEQLALRVIRSPLNGVVVDKYLSPGEFANENVKQLLLKLAELDPLNVELILPVSMFGSVVQGSRAEVIPEKPTNTKYIATVKIIDRVVHAASGTFGVRLELPNRKLEIPSGVKCEVRFLK